MDKIRVLIAVQACMLILNLDPDYYRGWVEVIVYPDEFVPEIERIMGVSSFACPSTWQVVTDRGPAQLVLKGEEDIRRLTRTPKRRPRQLRLFSKDTPGESVQVDVKFVRVNRQRYFQYTALDDCSRFRVLRLYRSLNTRTSLAFLDETRRALPFPIRQIQSDHGTEFQILPAGHGDLVAGITQALFLVFEEIAEIEGFMQGCHGCDSESKN